MEPGTAELLTRLGITVVTVPVGFLLYRVTAYFWGNNAYIDEHGADPDVVEMKVLDRLREKGVLR